MNSKLLLEYKNSLQTRDVDMSGANSLFGSIANNRFPFAPSVDFIPKDSNGTVIQLTDGNVNAEWLGLGSKNMQLWAYYYCSPLASVIDRLAEADTNGRIKFIDPDDRTTIKNYKKNPTLNRIAKLFKNPNPFQTWEEFNSEQVVTAKIFGYCPVWVLTPKGFDRSYAKYMFNLNPAIITPEIDYTYDMTLANSYEIKKWNFSLHGETYSIPAKDVMLIKDGFISAFSSNTGLPLSKIAGLDYDISNICAAKEADNVLLKKKGPLGVFSFDPKPDMAGQTPMRPLEKREIQEDLQQYGLTVGQLQYIVSKVPIKWNAMSFNVQELQTKETIRQGIDSICDRFGYPAELMSGKNATYENRTSAEKFMYQTVTIPFSLRRMSKVSQFFGIEENAILYLDYSHLPVLQEDVLKTGEAIRAKNTGLDIAWKAGMITWNEWRINVDRDTVEGMNIYYPEWAKLNLVKDDTPPKDTGTPK